MVTRMMKWHFESDQRTQESGIGAKTAEKLRALAQVRGQSMLETVSDPR